MSKVHQLTPKHVEGVDSMGNPFVIHLLGFMPSNLGSLAELPNVYLYEPESQFHFFLRFEFVGDINTTRTFINNYELDILTSMYCALIKAHIRDAGFSLPEQVVISDVHQMLLTFRDSGVCHSYGWLYRGMSQSFIFEMGAVFFHVYREEKADRWSIPIEVNGVRHQIYLITSPTKVRLDPQTVFEGNAQAYSELEDWFNKTVNESPYTRAEFVMVR
jgi:hypothetical protein